MWQGAVAGPRSRQQEHGHGGTNELQSRGDGTASDQIILMYENGIDPGRGEKIPHGMLGTGGHEKLTTFALQAILETSARTGMFADKQYT